MSYGPIPATIATPYWKAADGILERHGYTGLVRVAVNGETWAPLRRLRRGARGATIR